ncbi:hypothetical protein OH146_08780 [Salinibacterium sp. SYSU T00001]|nr:hypothetical protein [Salinibacterium sedimenticola]MCW4385867.1 hypothetical protein [Salinibacterium sedimenticola]
MTGFRYEADVAASCNEARMLPVTTDGLRDGGDHAGGVSNRISDAGP